jgi:LL-diaminopimelate aminotransferase
VSYIIQKGAAAVFTPEGQRQIRENLRYYKDNARILMGALDAAGIWYCGGRNAPYLWLRCPGELSSWEFFDYLLAQMQIVGTPGSGFGSCGEGYFRFSTFGSREDTQEAAARIARLRL